jgi:hypothetical protein
MNAHRSARPPLVLAALLLVGLFSLTCNDDENIPTGSLARPDVLKMVSGDNQYGKHQTKLAQPFTVQVLDSDNNPVPSHKVTFAVTSSSGVIAGVLEKTLEVVTNANGYTSAYLVLGGDSVHTVTAEAMGATGGRLAGSPVTFHAYASTAQDTISGDTETPLPTTGGYTMSGFPLGTDTLGSVGRIFQIPFVVKVTDSLGAGVGGLQVYYSSPMGGGVFDIAEKSTNSEGVASNQARLGYTPGRVEIQASVVLPNGTVAVFKWRLTSVRDSDVRQNAWTISPVAAGDSLVGTVGGLFPVPLVVSVLDTFGLGSPGQTVTFLVEEGGGGLGAGLATAATAQTSSEGFAAANFYLGPSVGLNRVRATVIRMDGLPVSAFFDVWGAPAGAVAMADTLEIVSGGGQIAEVNTLLPQPIVIRVLDGDGAAMPGVDVKFTVTGGGPFIGEENEHDPAIASSMVVTTNEMGLAAISMRMGPGPDLDMVVVAEVRRPDGSVARTTITAQALPNPDTANRLVIMSGNNQGYDGEYTVSSQLPLPLVVRVVDTTRTGVGGDTLGAPISNFPVLMQAFSPSGDGSVDDIMNVEPGGTGRLEALTDEDGLAAVRLTMGTRTGGADDLALLRNNNHVIAVAVFADGSQDTVVFRATAVPEAATTIAAVGPTDLSGTAGGTLNGLGVLVADRHGNLVSGYGVSYSIASLPAGGSGSLSAPTSVITDINGGASVNVSQLSTKVGDMKVTASSGTLTGSPVTFTIVVSAGAASQMLASGGNGQSSKAGTAYPKPLIALVFDQYQNPVEGVLVRFSVTAGSAAVETNATFTDADGLAETNCTPGQTADTVNGGSITVSATATIGGVATSVTFNLTATAP